MSVTNLVLYDSGDVAQEDSLTFSSVQPGTATAAQTVHLWNTKGDGAGEAGTEIRISALGKEPGDTDYTADIFQGDVYQGLFYATSSGLVLTIGAGRATVDNQVIRFDRPREITLTASETNQVWLTMDGAYESTIDGARPDTSSWTRRRSAASPRRSR